MIRENSLNSSLYIKNPRKIRIDASTICQLKCPSCPTNSGIIRENLGSGFLSFNDFKRIIDLNKRVSHVELSNWGEIFLNKEIDRIIKYAFKKNVVLYADNGVNLNDVKETTLENLVKYKFRSICCSLDGASNKTYSTYRVNGNFNQVIKNIKLINKYKAHYNSKYPLLTWQFIAFGHNEHEILKARRMAADLNMRFYCKLSWGDLYDLGDFEPVRNKELIRKETGLGVADRSEYKETYNKEYVLKDCCLELWHQPQINFDGRVLGCSFNFWGDYGNAFKDGLINSLNGEKIMYAREMLMGRKLAKKGIPCTECKVYKTYLNDKSWITEDELQPRHSRHRFFIMLEYKFLGTKKYKKLVKTWRELKRNYNRIFKLQKALITGKTFLNSEIYLLSIPLQSDDLKGWIPFPIFNGQTSGLKDLSCHVSMLLEGHSPHFPHGHQEEEILIVLDGEVDIITKKNDQSAENIRTSLKKGDVVYYPAFFYHTLQTTSKQPANYLMFKWTSNHNFKKFDLFSEKYNIFKKFAENEVIDGFNPQILFEGRTQFLKKLHCHVTTLSSGAGYEAHADPYDVAIIILEGQVQTLGKYAKPNDIIFYISGEKHGMFNPGDSPAKYVVFEFHA